MRKIAIVVTFILVPLSLLACAGKDEGTSADRASMPDDLIARATRVVPTSSAPTLEEGLLKAPDLGDGWTKEDTPPDLTVADEIFCGKVVEGLVPMAITLLSNVDKDVTILVQTLSALSDSHAAADQIEALRNATKDCDESVSTDGVGRTAFETKSTETLSNGDESFLIRASIADGGQTAQSSTTDVYSVRSRYDDLIMQIVVVFVGEGDDETLRRIVDAADERYLESKNN